MRTKYLAGALVCAGTIIGMSGVASAGEWAPGHGTTPIRDHVASSVCSFSGSDESDATEEHIDEDGDGELDYDDGVWGSTPAQGHAQSPGQLTAAGYIDPGFAGFACRGGGPAGD